jgi:hypothetical protein
MVRLTACLVALCVAGGLACAQAPPRKVAPRLAGVKKVYVLPMRNGFDQYLANHLTSMNVFEVVADPKRADAVISDSVGEAFQAKMANLYPAKEKEKVKDDKEKEGDKDKPKEGSAATQSGAAIPVSTFARGRGTVFVTEVKTMTVLWSVYMPPKSGAQAELEDAARKTAMAMQGEKVAEKTRNRRLGIFD